MTDTAPVMVWMSGIDKLCTYFNKPWLEFTGRTMEQELGNGWAEGVHPGDLARCLAIYSRAFEAQEEFRMEYRLRRHDGAYRWILDTGVARSQEDGTFSGYIGSCVDITERRLDRRKLTGRHIKEVVGNTSYGAIRKEVEKALSGQAATFETVLPVVGGGGERVVTANFVPHVGEHAEIWSRSAQA